MQTQDSGEMSNVVNRLRGRVWRDWLVAALFAVGVAVNYAAVNEAARAALSTAPATSASFEANPDGGLLVANRHGAGEHVGSPQ